MELTDFIYHASTQGQVVQHLYHNHPVPMGDFGNGIYLSNSPEQSEIWGNSAGLSHSVVNIYDIDPSLANLPGLVIDPENDEDLLFWITSIAYTRLWQRWANDPATVKTVTDLYNKYAAPRLGQYHWILSNRSDDGTSFFLPDFFKGYECFEAVRAVYNYMSFGAQLSLHTQEAENCISFADFYEYDGRVEEYEEWMIYNSNVYKADYRNTYTIRENDDRLSCYDYL